MVEDPECLSDVLYPSPCFTVSIGNLSLTFRWFCQAPNISGVCLVWLHPVPYSCLFITGCSEFHSTFLRYSFREGVSWLLISSCFAALISVCKGTPFCFIVSIYCTCYLISSHNHCLENFWIVSCYFRFELKQDIMIH